MPGGMAFGLGCDCCDCPQLVCIQLRCKDTTTPIADATVTIFNASDDSEIASGVTNSTGGFCATVNAPATIYAVVSKEGYHGIETEEYEVECASGLTLNLETCRTAFTLRVPTLGCFGCPIAGVEVTVTGDISGSGTSDSSGFAEFEVTVEDPCPESLNFTVTAVAPLGSGIAYLPQLAFLSGACFETVTLGIGPSFVLPSGCICVGGCNGLAPLSLSYTDDYGSATLNYEMASGRWVGSYTYSSSNLIGFVFPCCQYPTSGNLTVDIWLEAVSDVACESLRWILTRRTWIGRSREDCSPGLPTVTAPIANASLSVCTATASSRQPLSTGEITEPCPGGVVDLEIDFEKAVIGYSGDTDGTARIVGSCTGPLPVPPITITVTDQNSVPQSGATVAIYEGVTLVASKVTDAFGQVEFDESDGLIENETYEAVASKAPCSAPFPVPTFEYGVDPDFTIALNCPEDP